MKNLARTHFELLTSAKREANTESSRSSLTNQKTTSYPQPETEAQKRQKTQHFLYITYFSTVAIFFFFWLSPGDRSREQVLGGRRETLPLYPLRAPVSSPEPL